MSDEARRRRKGFRDGRLIRLADGHSWTFPNPTDEPPEPPLVALVRAVFEAEDRPDRLRCELALAINLLARNYDLSSADYRTLLRFPAGSPDLEQAQASFHALAVDHAAHFWPALDRGPVEPTTERRPGWLRGVAWLWNGRRPVPRPLVATSGR